jgi:hypothetical protein
VSLNDKLKQSALEDLSNTSLSFFDSYSRKNSEAFNFLYSKKILDNESIDNALEKAVIKQAKDDYNFMMSIKHRVVYADHAGVPEYLAYALDKKVFSEKEIKKIPFDHGQNAEIFIKDYFKKDLISSLRNNLLSPKPMVKYSKQTMAEYFSDPHPCCCD